MPDQEQMRGAGFATPAKAPMKNGITYVLAIGIDAYEHQTPLNNCVRDVRAITQILGDRYNIEPKHIAYLLNEDATRRNINQKLVEYANVLKAEDNFILLFSGHGSLDPQLTDKSYWLPVDCPSNKDEFPFEAVDTNQITDRLRAMKARHIFLLIDACFSGAIFHHRGAAPEAHAVEGHRSRWALTSGRVQLVPDGQPGKHSPFAAKVIEYLNTKTSAFSLPEMALHIKTILPRNSDQEPDCGPLRNVNDDGGFFFLRLKSTDLESYTTDDPVVIASINRSPEIIVTPPPPPRDLEKLKALKAKVMDLIRRSRLSEAFKEIVASLSDTDSELITDITVLQQRLSKLEREERLGTLGFSEAGVERQKITKSLLESLELLI
jgi:Caspase domain/Effector-associated domain 11